MNDIDALTLKLLTSKKKYNTYLETIEPDKSAAINEFYASVKKNKRRFVDIFKTYLDDPETQTTNEVDDAIECCFKTLLQHFEMRDRELKSAKNDYDETSDGSCEETSEETSEDCFVTKEQDEEEIEKEEVTPIQKSLWGKVLIKSSVYKKST
jgi:hypothetical protein